MISTRRIRRRLTLRYWRWYFRVVSARRQEFQKAEVVVVSFPKAGRTWLMALVAKVLSDRQNKEFTLDLGELADKDVKYISMTHDGANLPGVALSADKSKYRDKKVIFLVRDPRDVVVSYYFQRTKRIANPLVMDIHKFIRSRQYGVDRVIGLMNIWEQNQDVPKDFLLVRYEDLRSDTVAELKRIMEFIGVYDIDDETLEKAIAFASFDNMKQMEQKDAFQSRRLNPTDPKDPESYKVRRGKVGGYVDYLSEEDIEFLNQRVKEGLAGKYGYV